MFANDRDTYRDNEASCEMNQRLNTIAELTSTVC